MAVSASDRLVVPTGVVARIVKGQTVLLNADTGRYFALDEIGSRAWTLLTSLSSVDAAREALQAEFLADPADLARDVDALIERLLESGLVEVQRG